MYPFFEVFSWFYIYTFWITLTISFFLFLWMLKKLCHRFWINETFFMNRILWYFLSVFIFSRLFYVISNWNEFKFIKEPVEFFIMSDYNFSVIWAIFWFLIILYTQIFLHKIPSWKYIDASVLSFLFVSIFWYIWAFLWWQVYWKETSFWIEVTYNNPFSPVPFEVPIFPLAIFYSFVFFIIFSILYIAVLFVKIRWIIWNIWFILIGSVFIIFEFFSWKTDFFYLKFWFNLTQIWWFLLVLLWFYWLYNIFKDVNKNIEFI